MRSILPSNSALFCARLSGSLAPPPSPIAMYSNLSGPKASQPPLWFGFGWVIFNTICRLVGSARFGSFAETL